MVPSVAEIRDTQQGVNMKKEEKVYYNFINACKYIDCTESSLRNLVYRRKITYLKSGTGKVMFRKSDLDNFVGSRSSVKVVEAIS